MKRQRTAGHFASPMLLLSAVRQNEKCMGEMGEKQGEVTKHISMRKYGGVHCSEDNFVTQSCNIFQQIPFDLCRKSLFMSSL